MKRKVTRQKALVMTVLLVFSSTYFMVLCSRTSPSEIIAENSSKSKVKTCLDQSSNGRCFDSSMGSTCACDVGLQGERGGGAGRLLDGLGHSRDHGAREPQGRWGRGARRHLVELVPLWSVAPVVCWRVWRPGWTCELDPWPRPGKDTAEHIFN